MLLVQRMSASVAVAYPTVLKLEPEAVDRDLEDVFITDLDNDLTPAGKHSSSKAESASNKRANSSAAASINEEWRKLQSYRGEDPAVQNDSLQTVDLEHPTTVVRTQPRRQSEDVFLQPSQVEEMLSQNSLLLGGEGGGEGERGVVSNETNSTSSAGTSSLQYDPTRFPMTPLPAPARARRSSLWDGFISCINPLVGTFKKDKRPSEKKDEWEIPFADIRELNFIGSGSQGAVFVGEYLREKVAVKKVKDVTYCEEAKHLRKLRHPNIVKFK